MPSIVQAKKSISGNLVEIIFFTAAYVFDEVFNALIGTNFAGVILLLIYAFLSQAGRGIDGVKVDKHLFLLFLFIITESGIAFVSPLGCSVELKGLSSLFLSGVLILFFRRIHFARIVFDAKFARAILNVVLLLLILDIIGIGIRQILFGFSKGSGPYSETSHLAVYLLPILATRLLLAPREKIAWLLLLISLIFAFSSTLLIGIIGILALYLISGATQVSRQFILPILVLLPGAILIASGWLDMTQTLSRVEHILVGFEAEAVNHTNLSSVVWLNGWSQAFQTLVDTNWLGTGLNQMGCGKFYESGILSPLMMETFGMVLNAEDGSLFAAKLIAELGIPGIMIAMYLSLTSFRAIFRFRKARHSQNSDEKFIGTIQAVGALCVLMYLYVRGMGYFQLSILVALSMLYLTRAKSIPIQHG